MPLHASPHPLAGRATTVASGSFEGAPAWIFDWYDRASGEGWFEGAHRRAVLPSRYAYRAASTLLPCDDEVVLAQLPIIGKVLLHATELAEAARAMEVRA